MSKRKSSKKKFIADETFVPNLDTSIHPIALWTNFDALKARLRITDLARQKWVIETAHQRAKITLMRHRIKPQSWHDEYIPMRPNLELSIAEVIEIGDTLLPEFDPKLLQLQTNLDPQWMEHADRAPGISDEQMQRFELLAKHFPPPNVHIVTIESLTQLLKQALPTIEEEEATERKHEDTEEAEDVEANDEPIIPTFEPRCFIPLLWFTEIIAPLPYLPVVKNMYLDQIKIIANSMPDRSYKLVWKVAITIYAQLKQSLADYMARANYEDEKQHAALEVSNQKRSRK